MARSITFGPFRLVPDARALFEGDKPLRLGSRAFDLLVLLVERAGDVVTKEDLVSRVWPDTFVEEANLRVHIAALRKALGDGQGSVRYVANIPGRGYSFVAPVADEDRQPTPVLPAIASAQTNLPTSLRRVIGRETTIDLLGRQLVQRRFLTIVGPGGIGKTTVAIATAEAVGGSFPDGIWFVALAPLRDPDLVPSALGTVLGIALSGLSSIPAIVGQLQNKQALILFDSCEPVAKAVASLAEEILKTAPRLCVLATSREPLRAEGEWLHRLASLEYPAEPAGLAVNEAMRYSAIQLFHERGTAIIDGFALSDADIPAVIEICRRLDGVPLAIELAAARVDIFSVKQLAARLDDRLSLLTQGRRTGPSRHQTLRATLDWSYGLLPPGEQIILQRLAVFHGNFSMDAAAAVASDGLITATEVFDGVANLTAKSLVAADIAGDAIRHRLPDTTRAYAFEKLATGGGLERSLGLHARYYRDLFERAETEWESRPTGEWLAAYEHQIDNLRAALAWASDSAETAVALELTVAAVPLWTQMSLVDECRRHVERALSDLAATPSPDARRKMKLHAAHGASLLFTRGPTADTEAAWYQALALAEGLGDVEYQLRALWGLWVHRMNSGAFGAALVLARRFGDVASAKIDTSDRLIAERMIGVSLHYRGDQAEARQYIERMLAGYVAPDRRSPSIRFLFDQRVVARVALARILWLQGFPDQASHMAQELVDEARQLHQAVTLCFALAEAACPIALFTGDLAAAERCVALLLEHSSTHTLPIWRSWGHRFQGTLLLMRGELEPGLQRLRTSLEEPPEAGFQPRFTWFLGQVATGLGRNGQSGQALKVIDEAIDRGERNDDRWCFAELLRIKGTLLEDRAAADACFAQSLAWARRQEALSWELRTATTIARIRHGRGEGRAARALLAPIYGRFTEGYATMDLAAAKDLLAQLG